jgi:L-aminopeptidase/D-esterase-like protein
MSSIQPHAGFRIGHTTRQDDRTGVSVIVFDQPTLAAFEARGAAPGTRDTDLLKPGTLGQHIDAIVLTGGSTFGLQTVDGVMRQLAADGRGEPFSGVNIPLAPGAVVFDLANGNPAPPTADDGAAAVRDAMPVDSTARGRVGAGTGVRWGHTRPVGPAPGGFGIGQCILPEGGTITAVAVVNALGNLIHVSPDTREAFLSKAPPHPKEGEHTTLVTVITDVPVRHGDLIRLCVAAHDGLSNAIVPAHTMFDGDAAFVATTRQGDIAPPDLLRLFVATELAVERAIRDAIA